MLSVGRKDEARFETLKVATRAYAAGRKALAEGDLDLARAAFRWARRADPGNPLYIHGEAKLAEKSGNLHEAEKLYRRVLDMAIRAFGIGDPRTNLVARSLIGLLEDNGRDEEAWEIADVLLDNLDQDAAVRAGVLTLAALVGIYDTAARLGDAMALHRRALAWRKAQFGEDHHKVHECRIAVAELDRLIVRRGQVPPLDMPIEGADSRQGTAESRTGTLQLRLVSTAA